MNIIISGSKGNLGAYVVKGLIAQDEFRVTGYDLDAKNDFLDQLDAKKPIDFFIHFGEYSSPEITVEQALSNITSSIQLLEKLKASGAVQNFIYASSLRVYGSWEHWIRSLGSSSPDEVLDVLDYKALENTFYPVTHYANGKLFVENELRRSILVDHWDCKVAVLRIGSILGEDRTNDVEIEVEFNSWTGKMRHTRVFKSDFLTFLIKLISNGLKNQFDIINIVPKASFLNYISCGKNFNNY